MKLVNGTILVLLSLNLIACGKVAEELNQMYELRISNPEKAELRCTWTVDGVTKTEETTDDDFFWQSNRANEFLFVLCQKTDKGAQPIKAEFRRNDSAQTTDECAVDHCIVSVSGMTK